MSVDVDASYREGLLNESSSGIFPSAEHSFHDYVTVSVCGHPIYYYIGIKLENSVPCLTWDMSPEHFLHSGVLRYQQRAFLIVSWQLVFCLLLPPSSTHNLDRVWCIDLQLNANFLEVCLLQSYLHIKCFACRFETGSEKHIVLCIWNWTWLREVTFFPMEKSAQWMSIS